jgi:SAM-dependent methyltransferase
MSASSATASSRCLDRAGFDRAYDEVVLGNDFFEEPGYYRRYRDRYRRTLEYLCRLPLPHPARVLEVGGGQMALLMTRLFGDACNLADVNPAHAAAVEKFGLRHVICDLLHDDLAARDEYDLVVSCEVIEHIPIPPHLVLEKMARWLKPGGYLFLTTPNLYRLRNVVRLASGQEVFCNFFHPARGQSIGHALEYSAPQMRWQLERAGLEVLYVDLVQLTNHGSLRLARLVRPLVAPLLWAHPLWRDNMVACARRLH